MSRYQREEILVVPRALFDELGSFQGLNTEVERYLPALLDPANNFFMDREKAEDDPGFKQLIPYALFHHQGKFLHYQRGKSSGEARLHAKGSLGIGGHINPVDEREDHLGEATYYAGVERELQEELDLRSGYQQKVVALLNDDSNAVGQVHLGIVHLFELDGEEVSAREDALHNLSFQPRADLKGPLFEQLETWSQFCARELL
ncbi:MAG: hypothetical protein ACQKBY_11515 [Verrucomicrobiales bacterium]